MEIGLAGRVGECPVRLGAISFFDYGGERYRPNRFNSANGELNKSYQPETLIGSFDENFGRLEIESWSHSVPITIESIVRPCA